MVTILPERILSIKLKNLMNNKNSKNRNLILALLIFMSALLTSCKDNMINNVYLNLTRNLRLEDTYEKNSDRNSFKICLKDFETGEAMIGAEAALHFTNGYRITLMSGIKGIIETDIGSIPQEDFDVSACFSKNGIPYFTNQRIFFKSGRDIISIIYMIPGNCELKNY